MNNFRRSGTQQGQAEFLRWFSPYASEAYRESAPALYSIVRNFFKLIFRHSGSELPDYKEAIVHSSKDSGHIRVTLDNTYHILIQNLTGTKPSNDAMTSQVNQLIKIQSFRPETIFPVILKTQYEFTVQMDQLIYPMITRKEILAILFGEESREVTTKVFNEYRMWLAEIDQEFSGFRNHPPSEWQYKEWIGYSNLMEEEMNWGSYIFRTDEVGGQFEFSN
jgi:hypothetical protein